MVLPELTTFLATQGIGTAGTDLFYGIMHPDPDAQVVLYEYGGVANEPDMGTENIRVEYPYVQICSRGAPNDYANPRKKLQDVVAALAKIGVTVTTLSGIYYRSVQAIQPPFELKRDDNFRVIFACNFRVEKAWSAS